MSLIWADNFAMYGSETSRMLDGIYGTVGSLTLEGSGLDTSIQLGGRFATTIPNIVYTLPSGQSTVGQGFYIKLSGLPQSGELVGFGGFYRASSTPVVYLLVTSSGQITVVLNDTFIHTTSGPVLTASSNAHVEVKTVISPTEGSVEVRVRGRTVIKLEGLNTGTDPITRVGFINRSSGTGNATPYNVQHWTIWDSQGTINNNFLGQVQVFWNDPVENIADGGWTSNAGADAMTTLNKPRLANQLTASGGITSGNQVRIANTYYNWTSGDVNAGTPAGTSTSPWLVAMGVNTAEAVSNMYNAINASGVAGVDYSSSLVEHPTVKGFGVIEDAFCVIPKVPGTTTMTFSETGVNTAWASTTSFLNRVWDTIRMSAGYISGDPVTYPDAFKVKLRALPDDVTSIRAVLPIVRAAKIDGGDGNIQVSFGTSEDSYDDGPDTPITGAFTYWGNATDPFVSEINPETGLPWTPSEFNAGARIKVQRTK